VRRLLVIAIFVLSSQILVTLMKEVFTITTRRNIPEDVILHSHRRENLKSYNFNINLQIVLMVANIMVRLM
jgi:hypothetical protein